MWAVIFYAKGFAQTNNKGEGRYDGLLFNKPVRS